MEGITPGLDREALVALLGEVRAELAGVRREVERLTAENAALRQRVGELERELQQRGGKPTKRLDQAYSVRAEEQRQQRSASEGEQAPGAGSTKERQKSQRRGRVATQIKIEQADVVEIVLPEGCVRKQCQLWKTRVVWRIRENQAVRVAYELWQGPTGEQPVIDGVGPLSEFGREIHLSVAYLSLISGLSLDKICEVVAFFWQLPLSKSQANALLNQLSREWESEFDAVCTLLAHSAVVHADETSWSLNSVWALLSEQSRLLLFGLHKDAQTLELLLPKACFGGVLCSDDAAIYQGFTKAQKCWAHLLRKAIKFTLLDPDNAIYRHVADELHAIYRAAKSASLDPSLSEAQRLQHVEDLTRQLCTLCGEFVTDDAPPAVGTTAREFQNLISELTRLSMADELFTFVLHPAATGTNNEAERALRSPAQDRDTGRTSKTQRGARRRSILASTLESIKLHLPQFTLTSLLEEVTRWQKAGHSLFRTLLTQSGLSPPDKPLLPKLYPDLYPPPNTT